MEAYKTAQLISAYAQSLLFYKLGGKSMPLSASFVVSNRCNIHCSYCNFPNMNPTELSISDIDVIFSKLKNMGVKRLGLVGGEPLLRKDILEIIRLAKTYRFFLSLNTNLLLYEKYKNQLDDIDYFFTSLDGSPEKHIKNRGKQSYEKIVSGIRDIIKRNKKITAICVVTEPDISDADYLIDLAEKENLLVHFQPECYDTEIVLRTATSDVDNESKRKFWLYLAEKKKKGAPIASSFEYLKYISQWENYSVSALFDQSAACAAGRGYLFIDAAGYAFPCAYTKGKVEGVNMLTDDWIEKFKKKNPCTKCIVGPMLEFNLLFEKPFSSAVNAFRNM